MKRLFAVVLALVFSASTVLGQQPVWIQIEAQPNLQQAQERVSIYDARLDDVAGFYTGRNWYAIVLGPYSRPDATALLRQLRGSGRIPGDSFIATGTSFRQQFWPVGESAPTQAQAPTALAQPAEDTAKVVEEPTIITPSDETLREARASEALLDREQKKELQVALQWAGFYNGTIDGLYGRGTRNSMRLWQEAKNFEPTGVMTSKQRAIALDDYNSVLDGVDLELVRDDASGIQIPIPTGVVAFTEYEPPFARFDATGEIKAQVLLISQEGNQDRLFGLYEILQTLEIVPMDGPRERRSSSFTIEGADATKSTFVTATLSNATIKGFALIWPPDDEERRLRVLDEMRKSFAVVDGVLDPALSVPGEDQAVDLVSGLAIRTPDFSQSGFFIDSTGTVLTSSTIANSCERLTIGLDHEAELAFTDADLGLAVLRPKATLAPLGVAAFQTGVPRIQSDVAVAGFPFGSALNSASVTFGKLADIRGLDGETEVKRLNIRARDGDVGGPVFDNGGAVLGMLLPKQSIDGQVLPEEVSFSLDSETIIAALAAANIAVETTSSVAFMAPETLSRRANDQTVLVSCW